MPTYGLTIDGVVKSLKLGSLHLTEAANGRGTFSLIVQSTDGSYRPLKNKTIFVTEGGVLLCGGYIDTPSEAALADGGAGLEFNVSAIDNNGYTARRQVIGTVPAGNLKALLNWVLPYLAPWGITLDAAQVDGPTLPEIPFADYVSAEDALNQGCAAANGYVWNISAALKLSAVLPASTPAPFGISEWTDLVGDVTVEPIQSYYANQIIYRFSSVASRAYCYMVVTSGNFIENDTIIVGSTTYTFKNAPSVLNEVAVGATSDISLQNLAAAISVTALCVSYYGTGWWGSTHGIKIVAVVAGASGNSIAVSSSNAIGVFRGEGSSSVVTALENGSDQSLTSQVIVSDAAEIAAEGLYDKAISDPSVTDPTVALANATSYLNRSIVDLKKAIYITLKTGYESGGIGLHPGQLQSIVVTNRGLSGNFVITDVEVFDFGDGVYARRVTVLGGSALSYLWQDDAKQIFGGGGGTSSVLSSGGGSTTVLSSPFPLGGARERSVSCGTTPTPVLDYQTYEPAATFTATVRVEVKARDAGVAVTPGLYNMTDATWTWGSAITNTAFQTQDFTVVLTAGKVYRLDVKTNSAAGDAYIIGKLVA